jgi:hypothetical protein
MGMNGVTYRERDDETLWPVTECSVTCPNLHAVNLLSSLCEFPSNTSPRTRHLSMSVLANPFLCNVQSYLTLW